MTNLIKPSILAFALALHACNLVPGGGPANPGGPTTPHKPTQASEVDPGMALAGLTLLAGALTVLRVRRRK
jgi:LPXTG-motif cell wall-anchored protein